jgi:hypothetical protein
MSCHIIQVEDKIREGSKCINFLKWGDQYCGIKNREIKIINLIK